MQRIARKLTLGLTALGLATAASAQSIGSTYCMANANSTGNISVISATGSTDVSLNNVTLGCDSLPLNAFGYFITSQTQAQINNPAGSAGNICIGGATGRYAGNVLTSGGTGSVSLMIDVTSIPAPTASYAAMPGDTVNFQFWHRDASGGQVTSNFSEGLEITFDTVATGPSFETDIYPMLTQPNIGAPSCVTCHGGICGLDLATDAATAYAALINVQSVCCFPEDYVVPGDSASSVLYLKLGVPTCGGQMPQGGTFAGDVNMVKAWIDAGAAF